MTARKFLGNYPGSLHRRSDRQENFYKRDESIPCGKSLLLNAPDYLDLEIKAPAPGNHFGFIAMATAPIIAIPTAIKDECL